MIPPSGVILNTIPVSLVLTKIQMQGNMTQAFSQRIKAGKESAQLKLNNQLPEVQMK